jgi:2-haloacid dehalogenase
MDAWLHLQPFPEVIETLQRLKRYPRLILSNGSSAMLQQLCDHTGLTTAFDAVLSVDAVRIYKPAPPSMTLPCSTSGVRGATLSFYRRMDLT